LTHSAFDDWDGSIAGARELQVRLATQVRLVDEAPTAPRTIAGFDVGFEDEGNTTRAAAVLQALDRLRQVPDLVVVDGQGIAHPRRLGIAAHFGVVTGLPTIGVAKKVLCGRFAPPGPEVGARTPLTHQGEQIAWMLRSKLRCNPLIVSPGHRVSMDGAVERIVGLLRGYRLPEPTRLADRLASRRGDMPGGPDLLDQV
jgi:deoxyribonuclease V